MASNGSDYLIADLTNPRVLALSSDFRTVRRFGRAGEGPGEYKSPESITVGGSRIYVFDGGTRRLLSFAPDGAGSGDDTLPGRMAGMFAIADGALIGSFPVLSRKTMRIDLITGAQTPLLTEELGSTGVQFQDDLRNSRDVYAYDRGFVTVGQAGPFIEHYDSTLARLGVLDLGANLLFADRRKEAKRLLEEERRTGALVKMVGPGAVFDNRLFLPAVTGGYDDEVRTNRIIEIDLPSLRLSRVLTLADQTGTPLRWISTFAISKDGKMLAFDPTSGQLQVFWIR